MMASQAELRPYLSLLLNDLKQVLVDPIPEIRTTAAKGLRPHVHPPYDFLPVLTLIQFAAHEWHKMLSTS